MRKYKNKTGMLGQKYRRRLTFWWMIHEAGIIDKANGDMEVAENIRLMRDSYVHYQNELMFSSLDLPIGDVGSTSPQEEAQYDQVSQEIQAIFDAIYPTPMKLVNRKCLEFIKKLRDRLEKKLLEYAGSTVPSVEDIVRKVAQMQSQDFLDMLNWSRRLLQNQNYWV